MALMSIDIEIIRPLFLKFKIDVGACVHDTDIVVGQLLIIFLLINFIETLLAPTRQMVSFILLYNSRRKFEV